MKKIAYLVLAHNDPVHLKRMIDQINEKSDFYIHIDKKAKIDEFVHLFQKYSNVTFIKNRYRIYWGGFSIVRAEIELVREALIHKENYSRFVLLSGADYPIKTNKIIHDFFEKNKEVQFIRGINIDKLSNKSLFSSHVDYWQKHDYPFITKTNTFRFKAFRALVNKIMRYKKLPSNIRHKMFDLYQGSQWWALTGDCLEELIEIYDNNKNDYKIFEIIFAPDEKFFHTIFFQSTYAKRNQVQGPDTPIPMETRGPDTSRQTVQLANIHFLDPSMTKWFNKEDFPKIRKSDKLFVRKVSTTTSSQLLDEIDTEILNKKDVQ